MEEIEAQSAGNGTTNVPTLHYSHKEQQRAEHGARSSQWIVGYSTPSSHKEEETEAQSGGNGTKMVLPLNDTVNGPKRDGYGALSSQAFVDYMTPSWHKEEETESQRGGNGSQNWRKQYEDGATFKRHTKRTKT